MGGISAEDFGSLANRCPWTCEVCAGDSSHGRKRVSSCHSLDLKAVPHAAFRGKHARHGAAFAALLIGTRSVSDRNAVRFCVRGGYGWLFPVVLK